MKGIKVIHIAAFLFVTSCSNDLEKLTPPAERTAAAINDLENDLIAPANGWTLNYQPTEESGVYYMLLNFNDDGSVRIQSDVPGDNDYFFDQTVAYRIDSRLNLELIFETYGVFHYLFEQNSSTFGAEFEFYYLDRENENLRFLSKSDNLSDQTIISLVPAGASAANVFSRELSENLLAYDTISSLFAGSTQQIALTDQNISIFWSIDVAQRNLTIRGVAEGLTTMEVITNDNMQELDHTTGYGFFNGKLVLSEPISFSHAGSNYTFSEITLSNFTETGEVFCTGGTTNSPIYTGSSAGLGNATLYKTLFDVKGTEFVPQSESPYSVNVFFVADANGLSMSESENGSINKYFPEATGFGFNYGYVDTDADPQPQNAVGLYYEDDAGNQKIALRKFDVVATTGNKLEIQFTTSADPVDDYYPSTLTAEERTNLGSITDEIFGVGGGEIFALYYPIPTQPDLVVYALYNACNNYEFLLVK
ncbi:MAG: DUF4302 domain-containing protein [Reichenbachiella sp.]|uniref:DUF4302 domain-containing protein n=1 Tax=Reichenbachiella sp. TaxID=2184521 RepID=UPI0032633CCA